jgi:2-polyprenyl-6-methoxyphenol hydroxylase-like FAD-dependent oxidoreductase
MSEGPERTGCCIVGGGPGGAVLALLLTRQGVGVTLLEAHGDFNREFRGDTLHPSTLQLVQELSLLEPLLQIPHTRHQVMLLDTSRRRIPYLDFSRLPSAFPFILRMPQPRVLEFVTGRALDYANFRLSLGARVEQLIQENGRVVGVRYRCSDGLRELRANLVVGADGRFSRVRELAELRRTPSAQPIDLLWFRLPHSEADPPTDGGLVVRGSHFAFIRNRGDSWQVAYMLPKHQYQRLRSAGMQALRHSVMDLVPWLSDRVGLLQDWTQTSLLSVESSRAVRWHKPGLLLIGDAAHVMSPVGGVGINLAIQDAVAAANLLGPDLRSGPVLDAHLGAVQRRRELPTRLIQLFQDLLLQYILSCDVPTSNRFAPCRLVEQIRPIRTLRTRLFAFGGFAPEHLTRGAGADRVHHGLRRRGS